MRKSVFLAVVTLAIATGALERAQAQLLYGISVTDNALISIDPSTGAGTKVGSGLGFDIGSVGADFDCNGTLWAFSTIANSNPPFGCNPDIKNFAAIPHKFF